jgi:outer membrane protein assembly factor BamB
MSKTTRLAGSRRIAAGVVLLPCIAAVLLLGAPTSSIAGSSPDQAREAGATLPTTVSGRYVIAGGIRAMVRVGRAVYVGGEFGRIANRIGSGIVVTANGGEMDEVRSEIAGGSVNAVLADGAGGWYVGGSFTTVGDVHRSGLAHVLADGAVDRAFAPPALGEVRALALAGTVLVVAAAPPDGRASSHALDRATGAALPIAYARPQGAGEVRVLLASGGRLFIGFGRRRLAAYDPVSGTRFWTRQFSVGHTPTSGGVSALAADGDNVVVGGGFGLGHNQNLAVLDAGNGAAVGRFVQIPRRVHSIAIARGTAYVAYDRSHPGSSGLAAVDLRTRRVRPWGVIRPETLATDGTTIYLDGVLGKDERKEFAFYGVWAARAGTAHAVLRRVSPPLAGGGVHALAPQTGRVFVGGDFTGAGGPARRNLAAFDARTGNLLRWAPKSEPVTAMTAARHTIYLATVKLGEGRDRVAGAPRTGLAAVSANGVGRLLPWRPRLGYWSIDELAAGAGRVFVGGSLLFPGQENAAKHGKIIPFTNVAAFSARGTGVRLRFSPRLGQEFDVGALTVWHRTLIVGGQSVIAYSVDGDGRRELWRRSTDSYVFAFALRGHTLYAGGNFERVAKRRRQNLAALALNRRGAVLPFAPKVPIGVQALASFGSDVVFGGEGEAYRKAHQVLGAVTVDGKLESWHVDVPPDGLDVEHIIAIEGGLLVAGIFNWLGPEGNQAAGGIAWLR